MLHLTWFEPGRFLMIYGLFMLRYLLMAGLAFVLFYRLKGSAWYGRKIQQQWPSGRDIRRELGYSFASGVIFSGLSAILVSPAIRPHTGLYFQVSDHGWVWFVLSIPLMFLIHDLYFYCTHRLMHQRWLFRHVHRVHHLSRNPTPWAAFSFHPYEAVIEFGVFFLFLFTLPIHIGALLTWVVGMTLINVYGHLGWELYPRNTYRAWYLRWLNTSVSHNQHHAEFHHNYGLYTLIWDRLFGTLSPSYARRYEAVNERRFGREEGLSDGVL